MERSIKYTGPRAQRARRGFNIHLIAFLLVNIALTLLNVMIEPDNLWFYYPLLGWGVGLLAHGVLVYQRTKP